MKVLLLENIRGHKSPPWYWKDLKVPENVELDFYNVPEVYFREAFIGLVKCFFISMKYDFMVTKQCNYSVIIYSFLYRILKIKTKLIIDGFQTNEKTKNIRGVLKYLYLKISLPGATKIICYSSSEIDYYVKQIGIDKEKFVFLPLPLHFKIPHLRENQDNYSQSHDYILSAGRTGRDYETLFQAVDGLDIKVIVVADYFNLKNLKIPSNVQVKYNISLDELNMLIDGARFCISSLKSGFISRGQRVCLQYMAYAKCQLATDVPGITDYVKNGETGFLFPPYNWRILRTKIIELWNNPQLCNQIGGKGREKVQQIYNIDFFYSTFFDLLSKIH